MRPFALHRTAARTCISKFALAALVAGALTIALASSGSVESVHAKTQVPFRLMEATISQAQAALEAGTVTSEDLVNMYMMRIAAYDRQGPAINSMIRLRRSTSPQRRSGCASARRTWTPSSTSIRPCTP